MDVAGRVVSNQTYDDVDNVKLNIGNLPKGVYLIKVAGSNNNTQSQKLVVNRL